MKLDTSFFGSELFLYAYLIWIRHSELGHPGITLGWDMVNLVVIRIDRLDLDFQLEGWQQLVRPWSLLGGFRLATLDLSESHSANSLKFISIYSALS